MLKEIVDGLVCSFKAALKLIPGFRFFSEQQVGEIVDISWKAMLAEFLSKNGFVEGVDFVIPNPRSKSNDFKATKAVATLLEDIMEGKIVAVDGHVRNGRIWKAHFRRIA